MASNRGVTMTDVLMLPDELRQIVNHILKHGDMTLEQIKAEFADAAVDEHLATLIEQGFLQAQADATYHTVLAAPRRPRASSTLWQALDE